MFRFYFYLISMHALIAHRRTSVGNRDRSSRPRDDIRLSWGRTRSDRELPSVRIRPVMRRTGPLCNARTVSLCSWREDLPCWRPTRGVQLSTVQLSTWGTLDVHAYHLCSMSGKQQLRKFLEKVDLSPEKCTISKFFKSAATFKCNHLIPNLLLATYCTWTYIHSDLYW